ncbi:MAG: hypothetical protein J6A29_06440, partial [Clostridia bacterium]|nr:hypothetical protein [Clostridia bacterium]
DGKFINKFLWRFPNLSKEQLERLDTIILTSNDAKEICKYAKSRKEVSNVQSFEDVLIALKSPYQIIDFAENVTGVDIPKMQDAVIEIGNTGPMQDFAKRVEGCDDEKIKQALFEKQAASDIYFFFSDKLRKEKEVDMDDISKAEDIIIASGDTQVMRFWASGIKYADIDKIQDIIIATKEPWDCLAFAKEVEGADISKLEDVVIESGDVDAMKQFVSKLEGANINKLTKAIKKHK